MTSLHQPSPLSGKMVVGIVRLVGVASRDMRCSSLTSPSAQGSMQLFSGRGESPYRRYAAML